MVLLTLGVAVSWGTYATLQKWALGKVPIETVLCVWLAAYMVVGIVYIAYNVKREGMSGILQHKGHVALLFVATILLSFLPYMLYVHLLQNNDGYIIVALISTVPLITMLWNNAILKERVSVWSLTGVLFIVIGVVLIAIHTTNTPKDKFVG